MLTGLCIFVVNMVKAEHVRDFPNAIRNKEYHDFVQLAGAYGDKEHGVHHFSAHGHSLT